jgi:DGQHR domain-containing protein
MKTSKASLDEDAIVLRAIRTQQAGAFELYAFFIAASDILQIADISRIKREGDELQGFQRKEIRAHVNSIVEFLDSGPVLFPNAIILALSRSVLFEPSRGPAPAGLSDIGRSGTLTIPRGKEGQRAAWIVDGQQRSIALSRTMNSALPVPVIAFVSPDIKTQREQFILVNKSKPLEPRLINELLPEVGVLLPKDLSENVLPSELCNLLNTRPDSPFFGLIKRASSGSSGVISDQALITAIRQNLRPAYGGLAAMRTADGIEAERVFEALIAYWTAVKETFQEAWGKDPTQSRLMHSAGIKAMASLMDTLILRTESMPDPWTEIRTALGRLAPHCAWTEGHWPAELGLAWNEVQGTPQHITRLTQFLVAKDRELSRAIK